MLFIIMVTVISPTVPVLNTFNKHRHHVLSL